MPADSLPSAARPPDISRALPQLTGRIKKALPHSTRAAKLSRHRAAHFSMRFIGCPTEKDRLLSSISGEKYRLPGPAAQLQQLTCMALQIGYRPFSAIRTPPLSFGARCSGPFRTAACTACPMEISYHSSQEKKGERRQCPPTSASGGCRLSPTPPGCCRVPSGTKRPRSGYCGHRAISAPEWG